MVITSGEGFAYYCPFSGRGVVPMVQSADLRVGTHL